jgi:hypothetical protein
MEVREKKDFVDRTHPNSRGHHREMTQQQHIEQLNVSLHLQYF